LLTGEQTEVEPRTLYLSQGNSAALLEENWKTVVPGVNRLLFNLTDDPNEEQILQAAIPRN
jgi:hypothetical protein